MKRTTTAFEYLNNVAKLVFKGNRNKQGSVQFDGDSVNLQVNDVDSVVAAQTGVTVPGTLAVTGATTLTGATSITGALVLDGGVSLQSGIVEKVANVTLTAAEIVGTAAGDLGHADGAVLVAAPGAGYALQFISAAVIYDYDTAAYTGGAGDDLTIYQNSVAMSPAIATADLITKAGDTVITLQALSAADLVLGVNSTLNLNSTEVTQPGTAAGVIRVRISYNIITTGL